MRPLAVLGVLAFLAVGCHADEEEDLTRLDASAATLPVYPGAFLTGRSSLPVVEGENDGDLWYHPARFERQLSYTAPQGTTQQDAVRFFIRRRGTGWVPCGVRRNRGYVTVCLKRGDVQADIDLQALTPPSPGYSVILDETS